ncbi:hypothetical protein J1614_010019 [Plenodomus biglobosus]|nr:hypothetical protein J1614_010019 [Plenodomus biglobosus]
MSIQRAQTITIAIWCPSLNPLGSMDNGFLLPINKSAGRDQCINALKVGLQIPLAFAHDEQGGVIDDFSLLKDYSVVVVTTDYFESPKNIWTKELQQGPQTDLWMVMFVPFTHITKQLTTQVLTRTQRCAYMQNLPCRCCNGKHTKIVLTLDMHLIRSSMSKIIAAGFPALNSTPDTSSNATHAATIRESWGRSMGNFMGTVGFVRPAGAMESWDPALIPTLALLADATAGQVELAHAATMQVIRRANGASGSMVVTTAHLCEVIEEFMEARQVLPQSD